MWLLVSFHPFLSFKYQVSTDSDLYVFHSIRCAGAFSDFFSLFLLPFHNVCYMLFDFDVLIYSKSQSTKHARAHTTKWKKKLISLLELNVACYWIVPQLCAVWECWVFKRILSCFDCFSVFQLLFCGRIHLNFVCFASPGPTRI